MEGGRGEGRPLCKYMYPLSGTCWNEIQRKGKEKSENNERKEEGLIIEPPTKGSLFFPIEWISNGPVVEAPPPQN